MHHQTISGAHAERLEAPGELGRCPPIARQHHPRILGLSGLVVKFLARALLRLFGWRLVGEAPNISHCVVIFAPHTSNWDFPLLLLVRFAVGGPVHYLGKHTLFRPPFGWFFRLTGGIPVVRHERRQLVKKATRLFRERSALWLALSPEGTRDKTDHWKSGFYRIALAARVPVLLTFVDAAKKECGLGGLVELTGDVERDLAPIRAFYATKRGIYPEQASTIRFKAKSRPSDPPRSRG